MQHRWMQLALLALLASICSAQTRMMALGDSITNGGQTYASYRYPLWFQLQSGGYAVDFVGGRMDLFSGSTPNATLYPDYFTSFDRDHEGYWGWRTDQIAGVAVAITTAAQPDIVLIHLGTNDIGQQGAAGITNADTNLRQIITSIRSVRPNVTILLAQLIPIGPGTSYFNNAAQVGPLNAAIATIASDMDTPASPVLLVDQNSGFDLNTMMQSDGLHPNLSGETQIASTWLTALSGILTPGNVPPSVSLTTPTNGETFTAPADVLLQADASDPNGTVTEVAFFAGSNLLATDATAPFEYLWSGVPVGNYTLTAVATDDLGSSRTSAPVSIAVQPFVDGTPISIVNPSFEDPPLADGALAEGIGTIGGWTFDGTGNIFLGIFNPPVGSYPDASGTNTPLGADGANVAFLFNNGGPAEDVWAEQTLGETLRPNVAYLLTCSIGRFLPDQPYAFSTYGGYRIELRAGGTTIASDIDSIDPGTGSFSDALASVASDTLDPNLIGQPLSIYLTIAIDDVDRSTHFDNLRLVRQALLIGDADDDGDIDAADFTGLADCLNGPDVVDACADAYDSDDDGDVDMRDVGAFQRAFTGSL